MRPFAIGALEVLPFPRATRRARTGTVCLQRRPALSWRAHRHVAAITPAHRRQCCVLAMRWCSSATTTSALLAASRYPAGSQAADRGAFRPSGERIRRRALLRPGRYAALAASGRRPSEPGEQPAGTGRPGRSLRLWIAAMTGLGVADQEGWLRLAATDHVSDRASLSTSLSTQKSRLQAGFFADACIEAAITSSLHPWQRRQRLARQQPATSLALSAWLRRQPAWQHP
jgi:hypothetical protein